MAKDLKDICTKVCSLARDTGDFIKKEAGKITVDKIEIKGFNNFVTYVDKISEQQLVKGLQSILPGAGFITEEGSAFENDSKYRWVIDPLDGTTNFIHGLPPYSISIGLMENDEVVLGVIYEVNSDECFYSWKNGKAYMNDKIINVSGVSKVKDGLIATGFPYNNYNFLKPYMKSLEYLFAHSHGVRRIGSAAIDLAYVACGRFDSFYEYNLNPWDVAAGSLIVQQAGGIVSDFNGGNDFIFGKQIIASNFLIYEEFYKVINNIFSIK